MAQEVGVTKRQHPPLAGIPLFAQDGSVAVWAKVDFPDAERLLQYRWHVTLGTGRTPYAVRNRGGDSGGPVFMHRQLLDLVDPQREVDHLNQDGLDNRRSNLRIVSRAANSQNQPSQNGSSSRFRGVCWDGQRERWLAQHKPKGRVYHIGRFHDELDAARAAQAWRDEHMPYAQPDPELARLECAYA